MAPGVMVSYKFPLEKKWVRDKQNCSAASQPAKQPASQPNSLPARYRGSLTQPNLDLRSRQPGPVPAKPRSPRQPSRTGQGQPAADQALGRTPPKDQGAPIRVPFSGTV